jgi:hypothetical protein
VGNQLRFYYGAMRFEHSATDNDGALGLATLRLDGFVSLEAKDRPGTLVTRPFELADSRLEVNADARSGSLAAEVLDEHGRALAGLSRAECKPLGNADGFRLQLTWDKQSDLSALQGKLVRLKFSLRNAKLYAFQVCP